MFPKLNIFFLPMPTIPEAQLEFAILAYHLLFFSEWFKCQCNNRTSLLFGTFHYINAESCTGVNASQRFHYTHGWNKTARARNKEGAEVRHSLLVSLLCGCWMLNQGVYVTYIFLLINECSFIFYPRLPIFSMDIGCDRASKVIHANYASVICIIWLFMRSTKSLYSLAAVLGSWKNKILCDSSRCLLLKSGLNSLS